MSRASGWDVLAEQLCGRVREEVKCCAVEARSGVEVEVEGLLLHSVLMAAAFAQTQHRNTLEIADASELLPTLDRFTLFFQRQPPFEGSPSNLVFYCWNHCHKVGDVGWNCLLVEFGREYWTAFTKARDVSGVCFSAPDVWTDPLGCALQIFDWASERWP